MSDASAAFLLDELRQHQLLEPAQLNKLASGRFVDAKALTKELLGRGWLTAFQANLLQKKRGSELVQGQFVILERIGEGGMGEVFKARHRGLGRLVALKILRQELLTDAEAVARFYREIKVASNLRPHPNLVQ